MSLLELQDVHAGYGNFEALHGISMTLTEGEVLAVIGANGAGKSTLLKLIAGLVAASSGRVSYAGADLADLQAHRRVHQGISLVLEGRRLFPTLTVRENLQVGGWCKRGGAWTLERVLGLFGMLADKLDRPAGLLSGGEQQAVAIGRALMANPRLLLLDEVSLGLAPIVVRELYAELPGICAQGTTVLLVEQDVGQASRAAERLICLLTGRVSFDGTPDKLDPAAIRTAYFGM